MASRRFLIALLILFSGPVVFGQGAVPLGGEFEVNTYTTSDQGEPVIAQLRDGGFVVAWRSLEPTDSSSYESNVRAQRFDADGQPLGGEFQVNSDIPGGQSSPAVAGLADGGFVIAWHALRQTGTGLDVQAQLFAADGTTFRDEFRVNAYGGGSQGTPAVAPLPDGSFVVLWQDRALRGTDNSSRSIHARRFNPAGAPITDDFQVNSYTTGDQLFVAVSSLRDGGFVAAWRSIVKSGLDLVGNSVQGQRFSAGGLAVGGEFQLDDGLVSTSVYHSVAGLADGGFVVAWSDAPPGSGRGGPSDVRARRFNVDGSAGGGSFEVNSYTADFQSRPAVSGLANGGFVVAWQSLGSSGSDYGLDSIQARRFGADSMPLAGDFQVNSYTALGQREAAVSAAPDGSMAVVWKSADPGPTGSDTSSFGINGQLYGSPRFALARLDGSCLEATAAGAGASAVSLGPCRGDDAQAWLLELTSVPQRVVDSDGRCLRPDFGDPSGEVPAVVGECGGSEDLWRLETPGSSSPSALIHAESGLCLDAADGTPGRLSPCHGGDDQIWRPAAMTCTEDTLGPCLNRERFRIDLDWRSFDGTTGSGQVVQAGSDDSGLLWFFEGDNWELLVKVLDGCPINDRFWVFAAAATTVEYHLRVTDTATGMIREYFNPLGNNSAAITDANAFATCSTPARALPSRVPRSAPAASASSGSGPCVPSATTLCLANNRFSAEIEWRDYSGNTGVGTAVVAGSATSGTTAANTPGLFWFFGPNNWEMLVKVLDACDVNDRFLALGAATTDIEYTLTVKDLDTGAVWQHTNPLGQPSEALVHWFDTCP